VAIEWRNVGPCEVIFMDGYGVASCACKAATASKLGVEGVVLADDGKERRMLWPWHVIRVVVRPALNK
jgi:hypothetical protein